jgi:hypothetical protein
VESQPLLLHLRPPLCHPLLRIRARRESPPPVTFLPPGRYFGSSPLPPYLKPLAVGTVGLLPRHILRYGEPSRGTTSMLETLHKNTHTLRNQNWHRQPKVGPSGLTQGLSTPSLKRTGPEPRLRSAPLARIPWIRVLISISANCSGKGWLGHHGPGYIHMVISCW